MGAWRGLRLSQNFLLHLENLSSEEFNSFPSLLTMKLPDAPPASTTFKNAVGSDIPEEFALAARKNPDAIKEMVTKYIKLPSRSSWT